MFVYMHVALNGYLVSMDIHKDIRFNFRISIDINQDIRWISESNLFTPVVADVAQYYSVRRMMWQAING